MHSKIRVKFVCKYKDIEEKCMQSIWYDGEQENKLLNGNVWI